MNLKVFGLFSIYNWGSYQPRRNGHVINSVFSSVLTYFNSVNDKIIDWAELKTPRPIAQSVALRTWEQEVAAWFAPLLGQYSFRGLMIVIAIGFIPLTAVRCFDNGYVGKQPVAWKEYCAENWLRELQESMDRCTGRHNITEILLETALNPFNQSINLNRNHTQTTK